MGSQLATVDESQIEIESNLMKTVSVVSSGPIVHKISLMGDRGIGKTTFMQMSAQARPFDPNLPYSKTVASSDMIMDMKSLKAVLHLWELSGLRGGDRIREICEKQLSQNEAAVFMYSVNNKATWDSVATYYVPAYRRFHPNKNFGLIVGNVTNKSGQIEVPATEVQAFALQQGFFWCETDLSAVQPRELAAKLAELVEKLQTQL